MNCRCVSLAAASFRPPETIAKRLGGTSTFRTLNILNAEIRIPFASCNRNLSPSRITQRKHSDMNAPDFMPLDHSCSISAMSESDSSTYCASAQNGVSPRLAYSDVMHRKDTHRQSRRSRRHDGMIAISHQLQLDDDVYTTRNSWHRRAVLVRGDSSQLVVSTLIGSDTKHHVRTA